MAIDTVKEVKENIRRIRPPEPGAPFNEVEDVIYRRRSVRLYLEKQVPEHLVRRVLEAARFAPSSGNAQTCKFIVIRNKKMIEEMEDTVIAQFKRVKKFTDYTATGSRIKEWHTRLLMRLLPNSLHPVPFWGLKKIAEGSLRIWHGAPTVILILADMRAPGHPPVDAGIAGENAVLAAHSLGLGTCWVSFPTISLNTSRAWRKRLGIRYPYKIISTLAVGHPRGVPDGHVVRETRAIDWFEEDGSFKIAY